MTENDPKQVIIEHISEPLAQIELEPVLRPDIKRKGIRGITRKGEGLERKFRRYAFSRTVLFLIFSCTP